MKGTHKYDCFATKLLYINQYKYIYPIVCFICIGDELFTEYRCSVGRISEERDMVFCVQ